MFFSVSSIDLQKRQNAETRYNKKTLSVNKQKQKESACCENLDGDADLA